MTAISSNSILQQLLQKDTSTSNTSKQTATPSLAAAFAAVNKTNDDPTNTNTGNSYLLDLSDSAKAYLQNYSGTSSNLSASSDNGARVVLNRAQQDKLNTILAKYKDAPFDDDTFMQIQQDMADAGIGADTLAAQNQMRSLNPTLMLLNALSGGDGSLGTVGSSGDIKTQATNFMQEVANMWRAISTTATETDAG